MNLTKTIILIAALLISTSTSSLAQTKKETNWDYYYSEIGGIERIHMNVGTRFSDDVRELKEGGVTKKVMAGLWISRTMSPLDEWQVAVVVGGAEIECVDCLFKFRIDGGPVQRLRAELGGTASTRLMISESEAFIDALSSGTQMEIELRLVGSGLTTFQFSLDGFDKEKLVTGKGLQKKR